MFENAPAIIPLVLGAAGCLVCLAPALFLIAAGTAFSAGARRFGRNNREEKAGSGDDRLRRQARYALPDTQRYTEGRFSEFIHH